MINKLIADRKQRLNDISSPFLLRDFKEILYNGMFLIDPLDSKDITEAKQDNDLTDKMLIKMFQEFN